MELAERGNTWHLVNHRNGWSVLAAEFLHELYQQHSHFLNPRKLRTTRVSFEDGRIDSYTLEAEWQTVVRTVASDFSLHRDDFLTELRAIVEKPRPRTASLIARLEATRIGALSPVACVSLLRDIQHKPLGEIYELNLAQIEGGLARVLADERRGLADTDLSQLAFSGSATARPEQDFLRLVLESKAAGLRRSTEVGPALDELVEAFARAGSAYGASTVCAAELRHCFDEYVFQSDSWLEARLAALSAPTSDEDVEHGSVVGVMSWLGRFRDDNKRLLGHATRFRRPLLQRIAEVTREPLDDLRLHRLEELVGLVDAGCRVPTDEVQVRRANGLTFMRNESIATETSTPRSAPRRERLWGLPAARGAHRGRAVVVRSGLGVREMHLGDVLITTGTDFDMAPAIRLAGAVVTEEGGLLSHAAVVAREIGIPCIVGAEGVVRALETGDLVDVDADEGTVSLVAERAPRGVSIRRTPGLLVTPGNGTTGGKAERLYRVRAAGFRTPRRLRVVPSSVVDSIRLGDDDLREAVVGDILDLADGSPINLRSSSDLEDRADFSCAGLFRSAIQVVPTRREVTRALDDVAAIDDAVHEYLRRHGVPHLVGSPNILLTPYEEYWLQGVSAPCAENRVVVEHRPGRPDSDDSGPTRFEVALDRDASGEDLFGGLHSIVRQVACTTHALCDLLGAPQEVEWGIARLGESVTVLQSRPLTRPLRYSDSGVDRRSAHEM